MKTSVRWILAVLMSIGLIGVYVPLYIGVMFLSALMLGNCGGLPDWTDDYLVLSPAILSLGSVVGSILFGLNKRWYWWLGIIVGSGLISIALAIAWFPILARVCW